MGPLCHAWLFPSSLLLHEDVALSSAGDQLLILLPAWRAGPSPISPTQVDPISLRVLAPSRFLVGYRERHSDHVGIWRARETDGPYGKMESERDRVTMWEYGEWERQSDYVWIWIVIETEWLCGNMESERDRVAMWENRDWERQSHHVEKWRVRETESPCEKMKSERDRVTKWKNWKRERQSDCGNMESHRDRVTMCEN
jgi:hypothetical protein